MFIGDDFAYIQMQKTGCTHIARLFSEIMNGEYVGKHNPATTELLNTKKFFFSSIRNPWDWYLSLWAYGVQGDGGLRSTLTKRHFRRLARGMLENPLKNIHNLIFEMVKDTQQWDDLYINNSDPKLFRQWLKKILDPSNSSYLGEGFSDTILPAYCGFMSYRYIYLSCKNLDDTKHADLISSFEDLETFVSKNCYIDYFIRQENLESDFCYAIEKMRPLTEEQRSIIYSARKTNTSKRSLTIEDAYDKECIDLIYQKEKLIIDRFDYKPTSEKTQRSIECTNHSE